MARKFVVEVGEPPPRRKGRRPEYMPALEAVIRDVPEATWVKLTEHDSPTGARDALKRIRAGKTAIPEGEWEFKQVVAEDRTVSWLWCRYMGKGEG